MAWRSNIPSISRGLLGITPRIEKRVSAVLQRIIAMIDTEIHMRTPVWSGLAVRNMIWSMGTPNGAEYGVIETPPEPGPTNSMPLGPEPRRAANTTAARRSLEGLRYTRPFGVYYLSNAADHIGDLEYGQLPSPERSRAPAGMFGVTYASVTARLRSGL